MWRSLAVLAAVMAAVALSLVGCGDSGPEGPGKYAERYEEDRIVCGLVPHAQIAREFGIASTSHPLEVAEAYAEGFYGRFEQAAFEGCLDGIEDRLEE